MLSLLFEANCRCLHIFLSPLPILFSLFCGNFSYFKRKFVITRICHKLANTRLATTFQGILRSPNALQLLTPCVDLDWTWATFGIQFIIGFIGLDITNHRHHHHLDMGNLGHSLQPSSITSITLSSHPLLSPPPLFAQLFHVSLSL